MILLTGYEIIKGLWNSSPIIVTNSGFAISVLSACVLLVLFFSSFEKNIGRKINSPILTTDAMHMRADVWSNCVVLFSFIMNEVGIHIEQITTIVIVGFIVKAGLKILKDGIKVLLDASLDYNTLRKVEEIIKSFSYVVELQSLRGRNSGQFKFLEADIILKTHYLEKAHCVVNNIEKKVKKEIPNVDSILIHYEPLELQQIKYAFPLVNSRLQICEHFGEAMQFIIVMFQRGNNKAESYEILQNPYYCSEKSRGILTAEFLSKKQVNIVVVKHQFQHKGPMYVFADANIEVDTTECDTVQQYFATLDLMLPNRKIS